MAVRLALLLQLSLLLHCVSMHDCADSNCRYDQSGTRQVKCLMDLVRRMADEPQGERYLPGDVDEIPMEEADLQEEDLQARNQIGKNQQSDPKRNQLDRNFLRFGRSSAEPTLNKRSLGAAILPTYRRSLQVLPLIGEIRKQREIMANARLIRELSNKRGNLDRNFLRFGRSNTDSNAIDHSSMENNLRSKRSAEDREEDNGDLENVEEENFRWKRDSNVRSLPEYLSSHFSSLEKRGGNGKLDQNFLRFGRMLAMSSNGGDKRGNDRNFLRFGRRDVSLRQGPAKNNEALNKNFIRFGRRK